MPRVLIRAAVLAFHLLGSAAANAFEAPEQDRAGNRIEAFETVPPGSETASDAAPRCTYDGRWCAQIRSDAGTGTRQLAIFDQGTPGEVPVIGRYELPGSESHEDSYAPTLWARIVRLNPGDDAGTGRRSAMLGVVMHVRAGYSGGGASADRLVLIKVDADGSQATFAEMLTVPLGGEAMIRACFSEEDAEQRAGACHDLYSFSATLTLHDSKRPAGLPEFAYETQATSFPGPVSRNEDSLGNAPLKEKDLVTVVNEQCSYGRILRFDSAAGRYEADSPLPDCSGFTEP